MSTKTFPAERTNEIVAHDPATGEEIGHVALMNASDVAATVRWARTAQPAWAALSYTARAQYVLRARELVLAQTDEIANLISRETGKPPVEAISMEIVPTLDLMNTSRVTPRRC